ncbi:MAG: hypothetical protein WCD66_14505 [Rhodanobacteraceae bacterium]
MIQHPCIKWLPLVAASLLLAACAGTSTHKTSVMSANAGHDVLKQRAQQRWDDLINKHADKAYEYLTPGYRKTISKEQYASRMNNRPIRWKSAKVNKVECAQPDHCEVFMIVDYTMHTSGIGETEGFAPLKETWLQLRNQWYYLPREKGGKLN